VHSTFADKVFGDVSTDVVYDAAGEQAVLSGVSSMLLSFVVIATKV
jgi:hypothetical protein